MLVARAQDLMLHARVLDYRQDDWARLTYGSGGSSTGAAGWRSRPMEELPHWRVVMRRDVGRTGLAGIVAEHAAAIEEMRVVLRERAEISNRDFDGRATHADRRATAGARTARWPCTTSGASGEAMVTRRERFERIYAPTEAVAPGTSSARAPRTWPTTSC